MEKIKLSIIKKLNKKTYNFLNSSFGTKRSKVSFKLNKIIFLNAYFGKDVIGCIPLEPRKLFINNKIYKSFFITNSSVEKKFHNFLYNSIEYV